MKKINILLLLGLLPFISFGLHAADCDFSNNPDRKIQKCFGASGSQCMGGDPKHPVVRDDKICLATGYVTIGSIMHDNCCIANPHGYMCEETRQGSDIVWGLTGDADRKICGQEWNKAFYDSTNDRGWNVTFGPYLKGTKPDDTSTAPARDAMVYDSHGLLKRMWKNKAWKDDNRWINVNESKATLKLKAPKGTKLEFKEDAAFCASGKWADGACQ